MKVTAKSFLWASSLLVLTAWSAAAHADDERYVVRFRTMRAMSVVSKPESFAADLEGARPVAVLHHDNAVAVHLSPDQVSRLSQREDIASVQVDRKIYALLTPDDPKFSQMYGLKGTYGIQATKAWDRETGTSTKIVAVVDSGIDYDHEDLSDNVWINPDEIAGNSIDDDANGFIDDVRGYDFYSDDNDPLDENGHGTHVAGTIAAAGNNGTGVIGVAWTSKVIAVKCLSAGGAGYDSDLVRAIDYVVDLKDNGAPIAVINMSLGGSYSEYLYEAVKRAATRNITVVAAAGNESNDNDLNPSYPANLYLTNVISVAASTSSGGMASFSNYGATTVHVAAPGLNILSTLPSDGDGSHYGVESGTSMATPHVSGVIALMAAAYPQGKPSLFRNILMATTQPRSAFANKTISGGIVDGNAAVVKAAAAANRYKVSGTVKRGTRGVSGVTFSIKNQGGVTYHRTVVSSSSGSYSIADLPKGSYIITPTKRGTTFTPASVKFTLAANKAITFKAR
jgi:subtilisin family serine protease